MGKARATRHQKFLKSEKNKIKLKAKKVLPKGTNETKTDFKVKKIVIRTHGGTETSTDEPLAKSKLNLKELLSRLQHFNTSNRIEALNGVRDLINNHRDHVLALNVGQLVSGVAPLVLDKEKTVRRESFKTIHTILSPLPCEKISPFFDVLSSYLKCAMTHIDPVIQEDSLFYFDVLLECTPDLVGGNVRRIIPSFLNMISKLRVDSRPGRTLSMNLSSKMTSVKWRTKVLLRLLQFLRLVVNLKLESKGIGTDLENDCLFYNSETGSGKKTQIHKYDVNRRQYFPLHKEINLTKLSCFSKDKNALDKGDDASLQSYVEVLMPLMFDTWLEVRPSSSDSNKVESVVSEEGVMILRSILEIILLIFRLIKLESDDVRNDETNKWFVEKFQNAFTQYFIKAFPYSQSNVQTKKHRIEVDTQSELCILENLRVCYIYILFDEKRSDASPVPDTDRILNYIKWSLGNLSKRNAQTRLQIIKILKLLLGCPQWAKSKEIPQFLDVIIASYRNDSDVAFKQRMFELLCTILLNDELIHLQYVSGFQQWLGDLPRVFCEHDRIPLRSVDVMTKFAIRNNTLFNISIKSQLKMFVGKLPRLEVTDVKDKREAKKRLVSLLYWVNCWDNDSLNVLQDQLATSCYEIGIKEFLIDILKLKTEGAYPT